jgi:outer membrane protein OmpA-like peptidoglycan-associated protein
MAGPWHSQTAPNPNLERNLVPNGSFENYRKKSSDIRKAVPWQQIESVDYYQKALDNDTTLEKGAYAGDCYVGFRFRKKYKEFLQVKLAEPLHRGTVYEFSMQLRLAFWSNAALGSFGAVFTKAGYRGQKDVIRSCMVDSVCINGNVLRNNYRWITIKGFYKADGGEKFMSIGNFSPSIQKDMLRLSVIGFRPREAYYFVDDIRLARAAQFAEKIATERIGPDYQQVWADSSLQVNTNITVGEKVALPNITFIDGKYYLSPESSAELNKLAIYLMLHPQTEIRINGHSDNTGLIFKNQKVSELRAREVFDYLIKKGVQNKMYFKGFGSTQPIADNSTESGRAKNRRVEFEIIKK